MENVLLSPVEKAFQYCIDNNIPPEEAHSIVSPVINSVLSVMIDRCPDKFHELVDAVLSKEIS